MICILFMLNIIMTANDSQVNARFALAGEGRVLKRSGGSSRSGSRSYRSSSSSSSSRSSRNRSSKSKTVTYYNSYYRRHESCDTVYNDYACGSSGGGGSFLGLILFCGCCGCCIVALIGYVVCRKMCGK